MILTEVSHTDEILESWKKLAAAWEAECQRWRKMHEKAEAELAAAIRDRDEFKKNWLSVADAEHSIASKFMGIQQERYEAKEACAQRDAACKDRDEWRAISRQLQEKLTAAADAYTQLQCDARKSAAQPPMPAPPVARSAGVPFTEGCTVQLREDWIRGNGETIKAGEWIVLSHLWPANADMAVCQASSGEETILPVRLLEIVTP